MSIVAKAFAPTNRLVATTADVHKSYLSKSEVHYRARGFVSSLTEKVAIYYVSIEDTAFPTAHFHWEPPRGPFVVPPGKTFEVAGTFRRPRREVRE